MLIRYVALDRWLLALSEGWELPWIVQPMQGYHGMFAVLMERAEP